METIRGVLSASVVWAGITLVGCSGGVELSTRTLFVSDGGGGVGGGGGGGAGGGGGGGGAVDMGSGPCTAAISVSLTGTTFYPDGNVASTSGDGTISVTSADGTQQYSFTTTLTANYDEAGNSTFQGSSSDSSGGQWTFSDGAGSFTLTPDVLVGGPSWLNQCLTSGIVYTDPSLPSLPQPPLKALQAAGACAPQKGAWQRQYDYMADVIIPYAKQITELKDFVTLVSINPFAIPAVIMCDRALQRLRNLWPGACTEINTRCQALITCCTANPADRVNCPATCNPNNCGGLNFTW